MEGIATEDRDRGTHAGTFVVADFDADDVLEVLTWGSVNKHVSMHARGTNNVRAGFYVLSQVIAQADYLCSRTDVRFCT